MLKSPVYHSSSSSSVKALFVSGIKPFVLSNVEALAPVRRRHTLKVLNAPHLLRFTSDPNYNSLIKASVTVTVTPPTDNPLSAKAVLTLHRTVGGLLPKPEFFGLLSNFKQRVDDITHNLWGANKTLVLELLSAEIDPRTGLEKGTIKVNADQKVERELGEELDDDDDDVIMYETKFEIPAGFGAIGAVLVENHHNQELFLKDILIIYGSINPITIAPLRFSCNSWLTPKAQTNDTRIFFTTKSYLPSKTPKGLQRIRVEELKNLQGNGYGKRERHHRIYDFDVYNDLGNPHKGDDYKRPVLGGKQHPYPRRCRTGRDRHQTPDTLSEMRSWDIYLPRDEAFLRIKYVKLLSKTFDWMLHGLKPSLETTTMTDTKLSTTDQDQPLSNSNKAAGIVLPLQVQGIWNFNTILPNFFDSVVDKVAEILPLPSSDAFDKDKFFWFRDEEFARQTLAGLNPYSIRLVKEWPLKSQLEPDIYGPPESAITDEIVEHQIKGVMTLEEAVKQKKLYILDYHDLFLPYVVKVRKLKGKTLYGSRTLFFLNSDSTLRPIAIELSRPAMDGKPQWKDVFTPCWDATGLWLWRIAKAHVLAHDSCYHQLVSHWLRTHCSVEPYIIATHRQLSAMHPIYRLLHPHFRFTMETNAIARGALINEGGIIETTFSPAKYSMELSSFAYQKQWQFNLEALPADLIHRGLAVEDPNAPHGMKLSIEDYPYANDGLILWDALKEWATEYVNHYYYYSDQANDNNNLVNSDVELQAWWTEIRSVGHGDKKNEAWWPSLNTPQDLIDIVTTIMWVTSGHHAVANFGQYSFAKYFPNRPSIARANVPTEDHDQQEQPTKVHNYSYWKYFLEKPENVFLDTFPTQIQAAIVSSVLSVLSSHSPDEKYLGKDIEPAWADEPHIKTAFDKFSEKLIKLEEIIDERNANPELKNRHGAGIEPYQLLKPYSEPGVTGKGVPFSISI